MTDAIRPLAPAAAAAAAAGPARWTRASVVLHWLIVLLVVVQFVDKEAMEHVWRAVRRGTEVAPDAWTGAWVHIVVGALVLVAALLRLLDRAVHGRPPYPDGEPTWALLLAKVTHVLLYAILVLMPLAGLVAWFGGVPFLAEVHGFLWTPLLVLVGLHVVGAVVQEAWFRSGALRRMFGV